MRNQLAERRPSSRKVTGAGRVLGEEKLVLNGVGSPLSALVDFAGRLVLAAVTQDLAPNQRLQEIGCHASLFGDVPGSELRGEVVALHRSETGSTWQVRILDSNGATISVVSLSYSLATMPVDAEKHVAFADPPAPDDAAPGKSGIQSASTKRREVIAAAAAAVIARKGFANATMREIADAAGMHVPTMYQYVSSKDEMLEIVYNWTMARVRTDVALATVNCATAAEKLRATITSLVEKGDRFRRDIGVLNRELKSLSPEARARVLDDYHKLLAQIADLVQEGIASGEFRAVEPEITANFIEATCDIWPLRQFEVKKFGRTVFRDQVTELILRSLKA